MHKFVRNDAKLRSTGRKALRQQTEVRKKGFRMKREDITKTFPEATDEQINQLLDIHSADIGAVKKKLDETAGKLETAQNTITGLRNDVKAFGGVDVEGLKRSVSDWEKKYNDDITQMRLDAAINLGLQAAGARNAKLLRGAIDTAKIKLDGETASGLSEQIEELKKSDPYLFEAGAGAGMGAGAGANASAGAPGRNYAFAGSTGMYSGSPVPDLSALSDAEYYARVMKQS